MAGLHLGIPWIILRCVGTTLIDRSGFYFWAQATPWSARLAFAGVFALLIAWLLFMPRSLLGEARVPSRWWQNVRLWAILIAASQLLVYLLWI